MLSHMLPHLSLASENLLRRPSAARRMLYFGEFTSPLVSVIKLTQLSAEGVEVPLATTRLQLKPPVSALSITAAHVRLAMQQAKVMQPSMTVTLFFKDGDGDFVRVIDADAAWPCEGISDDVLRAWYTFLPSPLPAAAASTAPLPAASASTTSPEDTTPACPGSHMHQPSKQKELDESGFAASDGRVTCVERWLEPGNQ
jgi:hypothetical protein